MFFSMIVISQCCCRGASVIIPLMIDSCLLYMISTFNDIVIYVYRCIYIYDWYRQPSPSIVVNRQILLYFSYPVYRCFMMVAIPSPAFMATSWAPWWNRPFSLLLVVCSMIFQWGIKIHPDNSYCMPRKHHNVSNAAIHQPYFDVS